MQGRKAVFEVGREILFRGKRKENGKWVEGYYQQRYDAFENIQHLIFWAKSSTVWEYAEVDPETACQYTGLTDKNGRKIFEGDIVAWRREDIILTGNYTYCFVGYRYGDELIVRCLGSGFMLCGKNDGLPDVPNANDKIDNYAFWNNHSFLEVIGNLWDNPELLDQ